MIVLYSVVNGSNLLRGHEITRQKLISNMTSLKRVLSPASSFPLISTLQCRAKVTVTNGMAELKSIDSIPSPKGALPFLGHSLLIMRKMRKQSFSEILEQFFKELGPLIRLKLPGG